MRIREDVGITDLSVSPTIFPIMNPFALETQERKGSRRAVERCDARNHNVDSLPISLASRREKAFSLLGAAAAGAGEGGGGWKRSSLIDVGNGPGALGRQAYVNAISTVHRSIRCSQDRVTVKLGTANAGAAAYNE